MGFKTTMKANKAYRLQQKGEKEEARITAAHDMKIRRKFVEIRVSALFVFLNKVAVLNIDNVLKMSSKSFFRPMMSSKCPQICPRKIPF